MEKQIVTLEQQATKMEQTIKSGNKNEISRLRTLVFDSKMDSEMAQIGRALFHKFALVFEDTPEPWEYVSQEYGNSQLKPLPTMDEQEQMLR